MTKEQEEAIERLDRFKTIKVLYGNTFAMAIEQLKTLQEDIETVLNMLKEKDKEIEKKDKQIDLMAEFLAGKDLGHYKRQDGGEILGRYRLYDKNEWKQYFKNKLNSSEQN